MAPQVDVRGDDDRLGRRHREHRAGALDRPAAQGRIRRRAQLSRRLLRGRLAGGEAPGSGWRPGIPFWPPPLSNSRTRCSSRAIVACCCAIMARRSSRLAVVGSIMPVAYPSHPTLNSYSDGA